MILNKIIAWMDRPYRERLEKENLLLRSELYVAKLELQDLLGSAEAYMKYHEEKYYSDLNDKPTGLWPAIKRAKNFVMVIPRGRI